MTFGKMGFAMVLPFKGVREVKAKPILFLVTKKFSPFLMQFLPPIRHIHNKSITSCTKNSCISF